MAWEIGLLCRGECWKVDEAGWERGIPQGRLEQLCYFIYTINPIHVQVVFVRGDRHIQPLAGVGGAVDVGYANNHHKMSSLVRKASRSYISASQEIRMMGTANQLSVGISQPLIIS